MVYGYVNSDGILRLSRYVREWEAEPDDPAPEVNLAERVVDVEEHPLALELAAEHKDGPDAALAYLAEGSESDAPAVIRWMLDGGYKGLFASDAEFCEDQFTEAIDDHFESWDKRGDIGFPAMTLSDVIPWDEIAYEAFEREETFYSVEVEAGVYVFDVSIDIDQYRE